MKWIGLIIGAIVGVFLVRIFFLDQIETIAWELFWEEVFSGKFSGSKEEMNTILSSNTFLKCSVGFVLGGFIGFILPRFLQKS